MNRLVSVVVPTYNREETISRCIKSVFEQTYRNIEIIVVDDGSTDRTKKEINKFDSDRLNYIRHKDNKGANAARNTGIDASNGDYIAFLDSDDQWHPEKVSKQIEVFEQSESDVGLVYTGVVRRGPNGEKAYRIPKYRGEIYKEQLMLDRIGPTSSPMIKRKCFDEVGIFNTDLSARQDYEMWLRITEAFNIDYVDEFLVTLYIDTENRISSNHDSRIRADNEILKEKKDRIENEGWVFQRKVIAKHYESVGIYFHSTHSNKPAVNYLIKSIQVWPFHWKSWFMLSLSIVGIGPQNEYLVKLKNTVRGIHYK